MDKLQGVSEQPSESKKQLFPHCTSVYSATTTHKELAGSGMGTAGAENSHSQRGTSLPSPEIHSSVVSGARLKATFVIKVLCRSKWIIGVFPRANSAAGLSTFGTGQAPWCTNILSCCFKITLNLLASNLNAAWRYWRTEKIIKGNINSSVGDTAC